MENAIIVDLDGTLADNSHRVHHITGEKKDWKTYNSLIPNDRINDWCDTIVKKFFGPWSVLLVTGRPESTRKDCEEWLRKYSVPYTQLLMRGSGDFRADWIVKEMIYQDEIKNKYQTLFVLDDRKTVVEMWRRNGLTCLQCAPGDF